MRSIWRAAALAHVFGLGLTLASAQVARADYLEGATGYTTMKDRATGELSPGYISFAVLDRGHGGFGDTWATGLQYFNRRFVAGTDSFGTASAPLDNAARYLYIYQVSNNGPRDAFRFATIPIVVPLQYITSWGFFRNAGFGDDDDMRGTSQRVCATNPFGVLDRAAPPGSAVLNVYYPTALSIENGANPGLTPDEVLLTASSLRASFVETPGMLAPDKSSVIFGFTSDLPPQLLPGTIIRRPSGSPIDADADEIVGSSATPQAE